MEIKFIGKIANGQDGAIYNNYLFRLDAMGECFVYRLSDKPEAVCNFTLDRAEEIRPHCNSAAFGGEFYSPEDEFPLLYANVYNSYAWAEDKMEGVCCVYRIKKENEGFSSTLLQIIRIGFVENLEHWKTDAENGDVRPYGNFAVDAQKGELWAFTMRDKTNTTRYFCFDLPKVTDGADYMGIKQVVLTEKDIKRFFDGEYQRFLQGACIHGGKLYSLEGFDHDPVNIPALRIIDTAAGKQEQFVDLTILGTETEPEIIDFDGDVCYYGDNGENLYIIEL